jgi:DtxR family Mn-dependent transcriptional regulator
MSIASAELSEQTEEYLEAMFTLSKGERAVKTTELAKHLKISPASVTEMVQNLAERGYVDYKKYYGTTLTKKGLRMAKKMKRKHRLLERFLADVLKIAPEKVHDEACKMEHALSDEAEEALCKILNQPDLCPDDNKVIPACGKPVKNCAECLEGKVPGKQGQRKHRLKPLSDLSPGKKAIVAFIRGGKSVVKRLADLGLTHGTEIETLNSAPFGGPVKIAVRGSEVAIGRGIALKIFVRTQ